MKTPLRIFLKENLKQNNERLRNAFELFDDRPGPMRDALVRDHLVDHPDSRLAAWLQTRTRPKE